MERNTKGNLKGDHTGDYMPSVLFGFYSKGDRLDRLLKEMRNKKIGYREIRFIDVNIPLSRKDEILNFFKHFILNTYWSSKINGFKKTFIGKTGLKVLERMGNYKPIEFKDGDWKPDYKHKYLLTCCVPLLYQDTSGGMFTNEEKQILEDISKFKTKDYKADLSGIKYDKDFKKQDPKKKEVI
tara:strand:- start:833 stop:1381 length:549 start_codon:yes stop_codon:yes gene_type:complete